MEGNHISESRSELMLNDGSGEEGELREGSDDVEELQEPRGRETEQVLHIRLEMQDTTELRPNKSVGILEVQVRGPEKLGCLFRDCRNYVQKVRRLNIGARDTDYINRMFIRMHQKNSDFFHLISMDQKFNDVVCVDSTYLVNKYKMPTWLGVMGGQALVTVMTDQCESMGNAIKEVMPTTIQRYCIWHIIASF
ncbi:hypothetical protein M9H77_17091 [Catharanthus roseus]|uniref:Uncharacterized protein n=1 Tax=Catharanthus roseus TaxID=4058 RepID=A0ACC0B401_CATRO|nr:hypothetical protein M9H77_17091 [Catharanthus roseus]